MRGYLGNSARTRSKTGNRGKSGNGQSNKRKPRRRRQDNEETGNFTADDVVSIAELEKGGELLHLNELKNMPATDLVAMAEEAGLENLARSRKQDIIFEVLKVHAAKG